MKFNKLYQAIAVGVVAATCLAQPVLAQKRTIQVGGRTVPVPDDASTGTDRAVVGIVQGVNEQDVRRIVGQTAGGATLLPYDLPPGSWRNAASYPLSIQTRYGPGWHIITVNGRQTSVAESGDNNPSVTAIIPPGANFTTNRVAAVTAMANGATWQATGILFSLGTSYAANLVAPTTTSGTYRRCYSYNGGGEIAYTLHPSTSTCNGTWQVPLGISTGASGPFASANGVPYFLWINQNLISTTITLTPQSCAWTQNSANNWGRTDVVASGSIPNWPTTVTCDPTNVAHYFAGTGPFTPYTPPPDWGGAPG